MKRTIKITKTHVDSVNGYGFKIEQCFYSFNQEEIEALFTYYRKLSGMEEKTYMIIGTDERRDEECVLHHNIYMNWRLNY